MLTICVCLRGLPHSVLRPVLWQRAVGGGVAGVVELVGGRYSVCLLFLAFLFFSFQFNFIVEDHNVSLSQRSAFLIRD